MWSRTVTPMSRSCRCSRARWSSASAPNSGSAARATWWSSGRFGTRGLVPPPISVRRSCQRRFRNDSSLRLTRARPRASGGRMNGTSRATNARPSGIIQNPRMGRKPIVPAPISASPAGTRTHVADGSIARCMRLAAQSGRCPFSRFNSASKSGL
jgi:hypothetical protein